VIDGAPAAGSIIAGSGSDDVTSSGGTASAVGFGTSATGGCGACGFDVRS